MCPSSPQSLHFFLLRDNGLEDSSSLVFLRALDFSLAFIDFLDNWLLTVPVLDTSDISEIAGEKAMPDRNTSVNPIGHKYQYLLSHNRHTLNIPVPALIEEFTRALSAWYKEGS